MQAKLNGAAVDRQMRLKASPALLAARRPLSILSFASAHAEEEARGGQPYLRVIGHVAPLRIPAATAVGARDDFEQMTVQVLEIDATATVVVIDFT